MRPSAPWKNWKPTERDSSTAPSVFFCLTAGGAYCSSSAQPTNITVGGYGPTPAAAIRPRGKQHIVLLSAASERKWDYRPRSRSPSRCCIVPRLTTAWWTPSWTMHSLGRPNRRPLPTPPKWPPIGGPTGKPSTGKQQPTQRIIQPGLSSSIARFSTRPLMQPLNELLFHGLENLERLLVSPV